MILESHLDGVAGLALNDLPGQDVTLLVENAGDLDLHFGCRNLDGLVTCEIGISDASQIICNWISHFFSFL